MPVESQYFDALDDSIVLPNGSEVLAAIKVGDIAKSKS